MATDNPPLALVKKYQRFADLAPLYGVDVSELLIHAIEGALSPFIVELHGYGHEFDHQGVDSDGNAIDLSEEYDGFPPWAVFPTPEALKKLALHGEVFLGGGMRRSPSGLVTTLFPVRKVTVDDLVVLPQTVEQISNQKGAYVEASELPQSEGPTVNTLLKQVAALAILLSKQKARYSWGAKPNCSKISKEIDLMLANWPTDADPNVKLVRDFFGKTSISTSIGKGLKLIGFIEDGEAK